MQHISAEYLGQGWDHQAAIASDATACKNTRHAENIDIVLVYYRSGLCSVYQHICRYQGHHPLSFRGRADGHGRPLY